MSDVENLNFVTLAIKVPDGVELRLSSEIEVNGHKVVCQSLSWDTNSILESFGLQQRLEAALEIIRNEGYVDEYKERLEELREGDELIELPEYGLDD